MEALIYFAVFAALFFLMMRYGCGAHVMGHGHSHSAGPSHDAHKDPEGSRLTPPATGIDPVCGMTVRTESAKSSVHGGQVYYFCSQDCREKFEAAPETYLKKKPPPDTPKREAANV